MGSSRRRSWRSKGSSTPHPTRSTSHAASRGPTRSASRGVPPPRPPDVALRHSPLDAEHRALGARMAEFGGWEMPLQYGGVLEEHRACRERAVVFDVSHLGSLHVEGTGA